MKKYETRERWKSEYIQKEMEERNVDVKAQSESTKSSIGLAVAWSKKGFETSRGSSAHVVFGANIR